MGLLHPDHERAAAQVGTSRCQEHFLADPKRFHALSGESDSGIVAAEELPYSAIVLTIA